MSFWLVTVPIKRRKRPNTCSAHKCMRANTVLWGFQHPVQVSFAPPSWDVPELHRALPLPSSVNLVYLNVFCAAATAAVAAVQFWGWSFWVLPLSKILWTRGAWSLIQDLRSHLCFLWIWIWVLIVGPSKPMPHLRHTHTNTQCTLSVHLGYTKLTFLWLFWKFLNVFWYI